LRRLIAVASLVLVVAGAAYAQSPGQFAPTTDKQFYALGEPVTLILTNVGSAPYTFSNRACVIQSCFIFDSDGRLAFDGGSIGVPGEYDPYVLDPGKSCSEPWDQRDTEGTPLGAGIYYFGTLPTAAPAQCAQFQIVPEPSSLATMLAGAALLGTWIRRRR